MEAIVSAISTLGFPIVCVIGCAWFIYQMWLAYSKEKEKLYDELIESKREEEAREVELEAKVKELEEELKDK